MSLRIEKLLQREFDPSEFRSTPTLNDVPGWMIEELRVLAREADVLVYSYLSYHLKIDHWGFDEFLRDVVRGTADPKTWGYKDCFVHIAEGGVDELLAMTVELIKAELEDVPGDRWFTEAFHEPLRANNPHPLPPAGPPGVLVRQVPYWWRAPRKTLQTLIILPEHLLVTRIPESGIGIAHRRWVASEIGRMGQRLDLSSIDAPQLLEAFEVEPSQVSEDGLIALTALLREARLPFDPTVQVRGYIGPDEWYLRR